MTEDDEDESAGTSASEPPTISDYAQSSASWVGGRGTEPPAAVVGKIIPDSGGRENHQRDRRVVARGVQRREIDEGLIIQALLMIAKDLERSNASGQNL